MKIKWYAEGQVHSQTTAHYLWLNIICNCCSATMPQVQVNETSVSFNKYIYTVYHKKGTAYFIPGKQTSAYKLVQLSSFTGFCWCCRLAILKYVACLTFFCKWWRQNTGDISCKSGSGRPRCVRTDGVVDQVADLVLSQEDAPQPTSHGDRSQGKLEYLSWLSTESLRTIYSSSVTRSGEPTS